MDPSPEGSPAYGTASVTPADAAAVVDALAKCARAHNLYRSNNRVYRRFLGVLRSTLGELWTRVRAFTLDVDENGFRWTDRHLAVDDDGLAFLLYKEGIRRVMLHPGFEDEAEVFLGLITRVRRSSGQAEDLITLLWQRDLSAFRYVYVDQLLGGVELPEPGTPRRDPALAERIAADAAVPEAGDRDGTAAGERRGPVISPEDFDETLYFLDGEDIARLEEEIEREWHRDVKNAVVNALLDRLEDPAPDDRGEILDLMTRLFGRFIRSGDVMRAAQVVDELDALLARPGLLRELDRDAAAQVFRMLQQPEALEGLIAALDGAASGAGGPALARLACHMDAAALSVLARAAGTAEQANLRDELRNALVAACRARAARWLELARSGDPSVAAEAAAIVPDLEMPDAAQHLAGLLERREASVRLAAVEAAIAIRSADAIRLVEGALRDSAADVRIAAARGLARLSYMPARRRLETMLSSSRLAAATPAEKLALFKAYAAVAGPSGADFLRSIVLRRRFWHRLIRGPRNAELRACAALALGEIDSPAARSAVVAAVRDPHPIVRRVAARAATVGR